MGDIIQFSDFNEVKEFISKIEQDEHVQLWIERSRTVEGARLKGLRKHINAKLKYYELTYRCIHSGTRKSTSSGKRPNQKTFRQDCPFKIKLRASKTGETLDIITYVDQHSHPHNKNTYSLLPRQRQLDPAVKEMAKQMLKLRMNKKILLWKLQKTSNKNFTIKDLNNLIAKNKCKSKESDNSETLDDDLESKIDSWITQDNNLETQEECVETQDDSLETQDDSLETADDDLENALNFLNNKEDTTVELVKDEENVFQGLFFQNCEMENMFNRYPETLFVEAIYKASIHRMTLYIFAIEDGNGEAEIVAFFLAAAEDMRNISKMVEIFKDHNPSWVRTTTVITDNDFEVRVAFKEQFPQAQMLICYFYTLRAIRKAVNIEKMKISCDQRTTCLEYVEKMAYAKNAETFIKHVNELKNLQIPDFFNYLEKNWLPLKDQWVLGFNKALSLGNKTNNRLQSINHRIMQVAQRNSRLLALFKDLDHLLSSLRNERDKRIVNMQLKIPIGVDVIHQDEKLYMSTLTPYAFSLVREQFQSRQFVTLSDDTDFTQQEFTIRSESGTFNVSAEQCTCSFFDTIQLPCNHVLFLREKKELCLFANHLFSQRWTKSYYIGDSGLDASAAKPPSLLSEGILTIKRGLTQSEKCDLVMTKFKRIASLASESEVFTQRLQVLQDLVNMWESQIEVSVVPAESDSYEQSQDDIKGDYTVLLVVE